MSMNSFLNCIALSAVILSCGGYPFASAYSAQRYLIEKTVEMSSPQLEVHWKDGAISEHHSLPYETWIKRAERVFLFRSSNSDSVFENKNLSQLNDFDTWRIAMINRGNYFFSPESLFETLGEHFQFDAVVMPTGGIEEDGTPKVVIINQLDAVGKYPNKFKYWIPSGAYSPHSGVKLTKKGGMITEARASGMYLLKKYNVSASNIFLEEMARDTIGNGYFSLNIIRAMKFNNVLIVSNRFHLPRTRLIFDWCLSFYPELKHVKFYYLQVPDDGVSEELIRAREDKETQSMKSFRDVVMENIHTLKDLTLFLYSNHEAYTLGKINYTHNITVDEKMVNALY